MMSIPGVGGRFEEANSGECVFYFLPHSLLLPLKSPQEIYVINFMLQTWLFKVTQPEEKEEGPQNTYWPLMTRSFHE